MYVKKRWNVCDVYVHDVYKVCDILVMLNGYDVRYNVSDVHEMVWQNKHTFVFWGCWC